jgi:hypothetical protein
MDDYPLLGMFLTILWFFLFIAWISCLFTIFRDIFRSHDMSGVAKAGWTLLVVILPLIGVLIYLIARGDSMHRRDIQEASDRELAFQEYIRSVAASTPQSPPSGSPAQMPGATATTAPAHAAD